MQDLFAGQYDNSGRPINNNSFPETTGDVSVQHNVVATAGAVPVQPQNTNPVVTTNVSTIADVPVEQEDIKPVIQDTPPETEGNVLQQDTISVATSVVSVQSTENISVETDPVMQEEIPSVALDVAPIQKDVEQVDDNSTCSDNTDNISNYSNAPLGVVDAISLMEMVFPAIISIVENLLNVGVAVLASMPKLGKSWFCLLLCIAVATGKEFLGFATNKCEVLYLSFESTFRSLQNRMRMLLQGEEIPRGVHLCTEVKTLDDGLIEFLQETIDKNPKIKLIIVDTFQFIRKKKAKGGTLYQKEYGETGELKQFADKNNVCILLVHHLKNQKTDDVFQQMYGSNRY